MELIHYAGGELMTGEAISHAVLDYAKMLAQKETSDEIEIPIRREDGSLGVAQLLIGPASQLAAETIDTDFEDVIDDGLVEQLRAKAARLGVSRPVVGNAPTSSLDFEFDEAIGAAGSEPDGRQP